MTVTIIVLDSVGLGSLPDAADFSDAGSHTLNHTLEGAPRELPHLAAPDPKSGVSTNSTTPAKGLQIYTKIHFSKAEFHLSP